MAYLDENGLEHFWGKIKNHVSSAVAPKADDADVVHKTGDVAIEGVATFQNTSSGHAAGETVTDLIIRNPEVDRGTPVEGGRSYTRVILADAEGDIEETFAGRLGLLEVVSPKENDTIGEELRLGCYRYSDASADYSKSALLKVGYDLDGIPFSTAPATSDDRTNSTDIVTRGYMEASEWNWQKSKKNALVQFKPAPESDLEPVVDFMFTEIPPASGDKGPENPSTITGVSYINLNQLSDNLCVFGPHHDRLSDLGDGWFGGTVDNSNSSTEIYASLLYLRYGMPIDTSKSYCVVVETENCDTFTIGSQHNGFPGALTTTYPFATVSGTGKFKFDLVHSGFNNTSYIIRNTATIAAGETKTYKLRVAVLQCKSSEVDLDKYVYSKPLNQYTIQLGDTYYGGSLDVATGVMTVTWVEKVLDRSSLVAAGAGFTWDGADKLSKRLFFRLNGSAAGFPAIENTAHITCSHFRALSSAESRIQSNLIFGTFYVTTESNKWIMFYDNDMVVVDESKTVTENYNLFLDWFEAKKQGGDPVYLVYELKEPQTVQLTPTQIRSLSALDKYEPRVNTVYTDQEAVQVGYQRYVDYAGCVHTRGYNTITHHNFVHRDNDTGAITISGGSAYGKGGALQVNGSGGSSNPGSFILTSNDDNGNAKALIGKPNGTLTWNNKDITGDVHTTGNEVVSGIKTFNSDIYIGTLGRYSVLGNITKRVDTDSLFLCGGKGNNVVNGSYIALYGSNETNSPGIVYIITGKVNNSYGTLAIKPNGTFTWNGQNIQVSSDERVKTSLSDVPDAVLDAWEDVNWGQFRYLDAVVAKGESARLHLGLIAQHVMSVFEKHGLDACAYGILCHEERPAVDEEETVVDAEAYVDEEGVEHSAVTHVETRHEDAVDLWMVRYAEAQAMEACCMRRENARLKKRVADLEERLAALELRLGSE